MLILKFFFRAVRAIVMKTAALLACSTAFLLARLDDGQNRGTLIG